MSHISPEVVGAIIEERLSTAERRRRVRELAGGSARPRRVRRTRTPGVRLAASLSPGSQA